jgi:hypothetical protein
MRPVSFTAQNPGDSGARNRKFRGLCRFAFYVPLALLLVACATPPDSQMMSNSNRCTGPASFCNVYFGS